MMIDFSFAEQRIIEDADVMMCNFRDMCDGVQKTIEEAAGQFTLRDRLAVQILAGWNENEWNSKRAMAEDAYALADAMLVARGEHG